jgi:hypothetical protein
MVMRNRHEGTDTPEWWDNLPLAVQKRITLSPRSGMGRGDELAGGRRCEPVAHRSGILRDLVRLSLLFLAVAVANMLFLLVALSFLVGDAPVSR